MRWGTPYGQRWGEGVTATITVLSRTQVRVDFDAAVQAGAVDDPSDWTVTARSRGAGPIAVKTVTVVSTTRVELEVHPRLTPGATYSVSPVSHLEA